MVSTNLSAMPLIFLQLVYGPSRVETQNGRGKSAIGATWATTNGEKECKLHFFKQNVEHDGIKSA